MNDQRLEQLSTAGLARREAMLNQLVGIMERTHRARRNRRRVLAAGGCVCVVLVLIRLAVPGLSAPGDVPQIAHAPIGAPGTNGFSKLQQRRPGVTIPVQTDPNILKRYRAESAGRVERMDDRTLLETLAAINRPAGLIRFGEQTRLSVPVTDAELRLKQMNRHNRRPAGEPLDGSSRRHG